MSGEHGKDCPKVEHHGRGYLHEAADDRPYDVDGVMYCGRCHGWMGTAAPDGNQPSFGERLRGIYASADNPIRDGFYVKTIHRSGRVNPGKFYQLTDRKGKFWSYPAECVIFLDRQPADSNGDRHG